MPATYFLATDDIDLLRSWLGTVPAGRSVVTLKDPGLPSPLPTGVPVVVVLDAAAGQQLPTGLEKCPMIFVGEPGSIPFEQAKQSGRAKLFLSYEQSRIRLADYLPLFEEIAERSAAGEVLTEKASRNDGSHAAMKALNSWADIAQIWDFLEAAVENIGSREKLLSEFRRAARHVLHASYALFFVPEGAGFRSDRGAFFCPTSDPLVAYLAKTPAILDGTDWPGMPDPVTEMAVRQHLMLWSARLIVPIHDNGRLLGLIALGVRDDGQRYDSADRARMVFFARLLRQFLVRSTEVDSLVRRQARWQTGEKYFPNLLILDPSETPSRNLPLIVRNVAAEVKQSRQTKRVLPTLHQTYRISAGIITENDCIWVCW